MNTTARCLLSEIIGPMFVTSMRPIRLKFRTNLSLLSVVLKTNEQIFIPLGAL